ncbi:MAG: hypothetical protein CMJ18_06995 [Phycisphaeraceae bacterium]|nr:hypothetical protein [Phycisphaeraceae bacterium]
MELAGRNLLHSLKPTEDYLPYWSVLIDENNRGRCRMKYASHNVGRWWDAMLRLEAATGFVIPAEIEAAMLRNLAACFDNPLAVCGFLAPLGDEPAGWIDGHTQRESLLALAGLGRRRGSRWAAEQGARTIRALDGFIRDDGAWDGPKMAQIARKGGIDVDPSGPGRHVLEGVRLTETHGRMIEGLLEFHLASGDEAAISLADRLARLHMEISTRPDGTAPESEYIHTHSLFCTYRGLLMYGRLTRQREYVDRVYATYMATIRKHLKPSGFISHDWGTEKSGETTSPGDAAQLALGLARCGHVELLDDAERIVRNRLMASQVTGPTGIVPDADDGTDKCRDLENRVIGAFGGDQRHPHGDGLPTTDITAAGLHTLCDVYNHITEVTPLGILVNFHFDYEDANVRIETSRDDEVGQMTLRPGNTRPLLVRMPAWAPADSVRVTVNGESMHASWVGPFLHVPVRKPGVSIQVRHALPTMTTVEPTDGVDYHLVWRGDEVVGIRPNTDRRPFYPSAP